jgi:hypothetical protein
MHELRLELNKNSSAITFKRVVHIERFSLIKIDFNKTTLRNTYILPDVPKILECCKYRV